MTWSRRHVSRGGSYRRVDVCPVVEEQPHTGFRANAAREMQRAGGSLSHEAVQTTTHVLPFSSTVVASTSRPPASSSAIPAASPLRDTAHHRASKSRRRSSATSRAAALSTRQHNDKTRSCLSHQESGAPSCHLSRYSTRTLPPESCTRRTPVMRSTATD